MGHSAGRGAVLLVNQPPAACDGLWNPSDTTCFTKTKQPVTNTSYCLTLPMSAIDVPTGYLLVGTVVNSLTPVTVSQGCILGVSWEERL